ncbi:unnamed protein product [Rhizoctonia solani]|uniref:Cyanovirin-N domain-containing protein n=1 Tax=Rhizoctonia solani TaxID=456999 RepID=A0A8H3CY94_9AGAM|nr:unnamed protein product [Rhizoctonia solani]
MSFADSAEAGSIRLESDHILFAKCKDMSGNWVSSSMDLDRHIGNVNGNLTWDSGAYSVSSKDIHLDVSGFPGRVVLSAKLKKEDGSYKDSSINLNDRIMNKNGHLEY